MARRRSVTASKTLGINSASGKHPPMTHPPNTVAARRLASEAALRFGHRFWQRAIRASYDQYDSPYPRPAPAPPPPLPPVVRRWKRRSHPLGPPTPAIPLTPPPPDSRARARTSLPPPK